MKYYMIFNKNMCGFTLVELMITIFIASLLTVAFYSTYLLQTRSYAAQGQVSEMQQNARAGIDTLMIDLRQAGYDPNGTNTSGVTSAQATSISFTADLDENGKIEGVGGHTAVAGDLEHYSYDLNGTTLRRSASVSSGTTNLQPIADNIEAIEFIYLRDDGTIIPTPVSAGNLGNIRSVRVSILARSKKPDSKYVNTNTYTSAGGNALWAPDADPTVTDNFRRRLLVSQIDLRNMGL